MALRRMWISIHFTLKDLKVLLLLILSNFISRNPNYKNRHDDAQELTQNCTNGMLMRREVL